MRAAAYICGIAITVVVASPAFAWWQFVAREGKTGYERKVYTRFATEERCQAALKKIEAELKKKYPNRFPVVGTCEKYGH